METGSYEIWVSRLIAWSNDPQVQLSDLPVLKEESFSPATWSRLLKHIEKAIAKVMDKWQDDMEKGTRTMRSEHDFSNVLVHSRELLAKRVELASHPALPEKVRDALMEETKTSINDLQKQLEDALSSSNNSWAIDKSSVIKVVKSSPLTAVLNSDFRTQSRIMEVIDAAENYNQELAQRNLQAQQAQQQPEQHRSGFFSRFRRK